MQFVSRFVKHATKNRCIILLRQRYSCSNKRVAIMGSASSKTQADQNSDRTLVVSGLPKHSKDAPDDTPFVAFFEKCGGGGGECSMETFREDLKAVIYKDKKVTQKVFEKYNSLVAKGHDLEYTRDKQGTQTQYPLEIWKYRKGKPEEDDISDTEDSTMWDPRIVKIRGLNMTTLDKSYVKNVIESASKSSKTCLLLESRSGEVWVKCEAAIDRKNLRRQLKKNFGSNVQVKKVPHCQCLAIRGVPSGTKPSTLKLHFRTTAAGGLNGAVDEKNGVMFLRLHDSHEGVDEACKRAQAFDGKELKVFAYYKDLGSVDPEKWMAYCSRPPSGIQYDTGKKYICRFLRENPRYTDELAEELRKISAELEDGWKTDTGTTFTIKSLAHVEDGLTDSLRQTPEQWEDLVTKTLNTFMSRFKEEKIEHIDPERWENILDDVDPIEQKYQEHELIVKLLEDEHTLLVVGLQKPADEVLGVVHGDRSNRRPGPRPTAPDGNAAEDVPVPVDKAKFVFSFPEKHGDMLKRVDRGLTIDFKENEQLLHVSGSSDSVSEAKSQIADWFRDIVETQITISGDELDVNLNRRKLNKVSADYPALIQVVGNSQQPRHDLSARGGGGGGGGGGAAVGQETLTLRIVANSQTDIRKIAEKLRGMANS